MRKKMTAIVLAVLAFSMIAASAATLGGITTAQLGADVATIATCDSNGVDADFTVAFNGGEYKATAAHITAIEAACDGKDISVTLLDSLGVTLGSATGQVGAITSGEFDATGMNASAAAVAKIAVVIEG